MPIIGKLIQKGIPQTYMVAIGFAIFFGFTFWMYSIMTPDTGSEHMFNPLLLRGIGLGLLFVPITTLSLSSLKGREIGDGAAFTGMMRQLGGSFGIAIITTYIARWSQNHRVDLISNLNGSSLTVQQRIEQLKIGFMSKGYPANEALEKAYKILELSVTKQATVLSYMDVFMFLGILFLACIPIVLFVKTGKGKVDLSNVH